MFRRLAFRALVQQVIDAAQHGKTGFIDRLEGGRGRPGRLHLGPQQGRPDVAVMGQRGAKADRLIAGGQRADVALRGAAPGAAGLDQRLPALAGIIDQGVEQAGVAALYLPLDLRPIRGEALQLVIHHLVGDQQVAERHVLGGHAGGYAHQHHVARVPAADGVAGGGGGLQAAGIQQAQHHHLVGAGGGVGKGDRQVGLVIDADVVLVGGQLPAARQAFEQGIALGGQRGDQEKVNPRKRLGRCLHGVSP